MFGFFKRKDPELENFKNLFEGKILVEPLKTKINRHHIFWIGRSKHDKAFRIGVEFKGGRKYFYDWENFHTDARCSEFQILTPQEADALEERIKTERKSKKEKGS